MENQNVPNQGQTPEQNQPEVKKVTLFEGLELTEDMIPKLLESEFIKKKLTSEADRVRTEYSKKLKAAEDEKNQLKLSMMTEEEKLKMQHQEKETMFAEMQKELLDLKTVKLLTEKGLPESALKLINGSTIEDRKEQIKAFEEMFKTTIQTQTQQVQVEKKEVLANNHKAPEQGNTAGVLTREQMNELARTNPKEFLKRAAEFERLERNNMLK